MSRPNSKSTGASNSPKSSRTRQLDSGVPEERSDSIQEAKVGNNFGDAPIHVPTSGAQTYGVYHVIGQVSTIQGQNPEEAAGACQQEESDHQANSNVISASLDKIRHENEQRNSELQMVKKQLSESKLNESQLKEKVYELTKKIEKLQNEKESLEKELRQKKQETDKTIEELQQEITKLNSQLKGMEAAVESVKERLASNEKQSRVETKQHEEEIESLQNKREELNTTVTKLQYDKERQEIESTKEIVRLREALSKKKGEEAEQTMKLCGLQVQYADAKNEILEQKLKISEISSQELRKQVQALKILRGPIAGTEAESFEDSQSKEVLFKVGDGAIDSP